jgi:hypothetical protein
MTVSVDRANQLAAGSEALIALGSPGSWSSKPDMQLRL